MSKSPSPVARSLLEEAGYRVLFRTNGWAECFVHREAAPLEATEALPMTGALLATAAERWEGRGETQEDALEDVLGRMFPSHLARVLFDRECAASRMPVAAPSSVRAVERSAAIPDAITEPQPPPSSERRAVQAGTAGLAVPMPAPEGDGAARPDTGGAALPVTEVANHALGPASASPPVATTPLAFRDGGTESRLDQPPASRLPAVVPAPEPSAPVLADASATVVPAREVTASEAPAEAPHAASHPAQSPSAAEASRSIAVEKPARVRTADALEAVEKVLAEIEERLPHLARMCSERQRLHMLAWICRARAIEEGQPGAREVEHAVARVARRLTEIGKMFWPGSVRALQLSARPADVRREMHASWASEPASWREATVLSERLLSEHLAKSAEAGLDEDGWADGAARSPRPSDPDGLFEEVDAELKAMLVPPGEVPNARLGELAAPSSTSSWRPPASCAGCAATCATTWLGASPWGGSGAPCPAWATAAGASATPSITAPSHRRPGPSCSGRCRPSLPRRRGRARTSCRAALPAASTTKEGLLAWLIRAFDVLNTPDLVALVLPLKAELVGWGDDVLNHPDRRIRRRLRELVKRVLSEEAVAAPKAPEPPVRDEENAADEPIAQHALDALAARVRAQTRGRRVLFVSNREDPELGARLSELLGITIAWCDGSLRRVQAQCERITRGSYDLVLSATGFQVHGVDSALARASSAASIPYVRVNRGRPVACVQAIAREFGLASGTYPTPVMLPSAASKST